MVVQDVGSIWQYMLTNAFDTSILYTLVKVIKYIVIFMNDHSLPPIFYLYLIGRKGYFTDNVYAHICMCVCACVRACVCACMYVCVCVYVFSQNH